jgi:hypothetical protein
MFEDSFLAEITMEMKSGLANLFFSAERFNLLNPMMARVINVP